MTPTADLATLVPITSQLRSLHTSTGPLGDAVQSIPGWCRARDQLIALGDDRPVPLGPADAEHAVASLLRDTVAAGRPVDAEVRRQAAQIAVNANADLMVSRATQQLRGELATMLDAELGAGSAQLFSHLHRQLMQVLGSARELLPRLGGVCDPAAAIATGRADEWQTWQGLVAGYSAIRQAQGKVFRSLDSLGRSRLPSPHGFVAAAPAIDSDFGARESRHTTAGTSGEQRPPREPPWPDSWSGEAALRWCARNPAAQPHVPTFAQLAAAVERGDAAARSYVRVNLDSRPLHRDELLTTR